MYAYEIAAPGGFTISDDQSLLDLQVVHRFIAEQSYWGRGRDRVLFERAIRHSICLGLYAADRVQIGFARATGDRTFRAHLNDVFVLDGWRGQGLGRALVAAMLAHPEHATVRVWTLQTDDAHAL